MKKRKSTDYSFLTRLRRFIKINIWVQKFVKDAFGKWYWFSVAHTFLRSLALTVDALLIGFMLNEAQFLILQSTKKPEKLYIYLILWFAWKLIIRTMFSTKHRFSWFYSEFGLGNYLTKKILNKLTSLNWATIETAKTQKLIRQTTELSEHHILSLGDKQVDMITLFVATAIGIVGAHIPLWVVAIIIAKEFPSIIVNSHLASKTFKLNEETVPLSTQKDGIYSYFRHFSTLAEIKISRANVKLQQTFDELVAKIYKLFWKKDVAAFIPTNFINIMEISVNTGLYVYYLLQVVYKSLPFGSFQATMGVITQIGNNFYDLISQLTTSVDHYRYASYAYDLFNLPDATSQNEKYELNTDKIRIEFKDVTFRYSGNDHDALQNVNLVIEDNDRIAIVGENGAGKSTFLKLLTLLYKPTSGQILINDIPLERYKLDSIYNKIAVVTQDFARYDVLTVAQNIGIYSQTPAIDQERLIHAAKLACADELIEKLPHKYETVLTKRIEDGVELSTGQWQRLAIARQFYANRPLVILDEPTSAIDPIAESKIFTNLYEHLKDKTVIVVSHRYNTVKAAKKILVFNDGKIIEQGSHDELLQKDGYYANAYRVQNEEKKL